MEAVTAGGVLQQARLSFVARAASAREVLVLGEGPGRFLGEWLARSPNSTVTCIEESPAMIRECRRNLARLQLDARRVGFVRTDVLKWEPPAARYDLAVAHCFLDCFAPRELAEVVEKVSRACRPDALWLVADFHQPGRGWRKWRAAALLPVMYAFFRAVAGVNARRLVPPDPLLAQAGFVLESRRIFNFGFIRSDVWRRGRGC
jgi:SAM-dependent methyltransferase